MKLRNKHNGEVYFAETNQPQNINFGIRLFVWKEAGSTSGQTYFYNSIEALCRDWEDA